MILLILKYTLLRHGVSGDPPQNPEILHVQSIPRCLRLPLHPPIPPPVRQVEQTSHQGRCHAFYNSGPSHHGHGRWHPMIFQYVYSTYVPAFRSRVMTTCTLHTVCSSSSLSLVFFTSTPDGVFQLSIDPTCHQPGIQNRSETTRTYDEQQHRSPCRAPGNKRQDRYSCHSKDAEYSASADACPPSSRPFVVHHLIPSTPGATLWPMMFPTTQTPESQAPPLPPNRVRSAFLNTLVYHFASSLRFLIHTVASQPALKTNSNIKSHAVPKRTKHLSGCVAYFRMHFKLATNSSLKALI